MIKSANSHCEVLIFAVYKNLAIDKNISQKLLKLFLRCGDIYRKTSFFYAFTNYLVNVRGYH